MPVNLRWRLAVALLGLALINPPEVAAKINHFKDDQGTLHISNDREAEAGKGNGTKLNMPGRRRGGSPQAIAPMTPPPPPEPEAPPPEPVTLPPAEVAEPQKGVQEETPSADEVQPDPGSVPGRYNRGGRGRR